MDINKCKSLMDYYEKSGLGLFTFTPSEPRNLFERTIGRKRYNERIEQERKEFLKKKQEKLDEILNNYEEIIQSSLDSIESNLQSKDALHIHNQEVNFNEILNFVVKLGQNKQVISPQSQARIYSLMMNAVKMANDMYDKNQDVEFIRNDQKTLLYVHDVGKLGTLSDMLGFPLTKSDFDSLTKFIRKPSRENRRQKGFDEINTNKYVENNETYWKSKGVDIKQFMQGATRNSHPSNEPARQSTSQNANETRKYSFNFSSSTSTTEKEQTQSQPTQTQPQKDISEKNQYVDSSNLTTSQIVHDAYEWYEEYCKKEVQKAIDNKQPSINNFGYYAIVDPSGKRISYSLKNSEKTKQALQGMTCEADHVTPRKSHDLSREAHIIYAYLWQSGKFKTDLVGDKTHPETCMAQLSDPKIAKFSSYFIDYYQRAIDRAKQQEQESERDM